MESKKPNLLRSFRYAFEGMYAAIKTETNWKIGLVESILVILAGLYFKISTSEWIMVIILIGVVLSAELGNSATEAIVDSFTSDQHPGAKKAKDFYAGAVVLVIIAAAIAGFMIFWPYLKQLL